MKSIMEALGDRCAGIAVAHAVTLALVLCLWGASVLLSRQTTPLPENTAAASVALAQHAAAPGDSTHP